MLLGNVIGSNLFNIGLVGGIAGLFGAVTTSVPFPWIDYAFPFDPFVSDSSENKLIELWYCIPFNLHYF